MVQLCIFIMLRYVIAQWFPTGGVHDEVVRLCHKKENPLVKCSEFHFDVPFLCSWRVAASPTATLQYSTGEHEYETEYIHLCFTY